MKKIKLITPILTISTLAAGLTACLTSCNTTKEFDGSVTNEEWENGWKSIAYDQGNLQYQATGQVGIIEYDDAGEKAITAGQYNGIVVNDSAEYAEVSEIEIETSQRAKGYFASKILSDSQYVNCDYLKVVGGQEETIVQYAITDQPVVSILFDEAKTLAKNRGSFTFDKDKQQYHLLLKEKSGDVTYADITVKFNNKKKIVKLAYNITVDKVKENDVTHDKQDKFCDLTFEYINVEVPKIQDFEDKYNVAKGRVAIMQNAEETTIHSRNNDDKDFGYKSILTIKPSSSNTGKNCVQITKNSSLTWNKILPFKPNVYLNYSKVDATITEDTDTYYIKFPQAFTSTDKIELYFNTLGDIGGVDAGMKATLIEK